MYSDESPNLSYRCLYTLFLNNEEIKFHIFSIILSITISVVSFKNKSGYTNN